MWPHRLALAALLLAVLLPIRLRPWAERPEPRACHDAPRGAEPRHWLGCAADPGPPGDLRDDERLVLGLPVDLNGADARVLAFVPGLSARLAAAVVAERAAGGPFGSVDALVRVRGVGPRRLEQARASLVVEPTP